MSQDFSLGQSYHVQYLIITGAKIHNRSKSLSDKKKNKPSQGDTGFKISKNFIQFCSFQVFKSLNFIKVCQILFMAKTPKLNK